MIEGLTDHLSWKGYSARRFMSLDIGVPELAMPNRFFKKVPMLDESLSLFEQTETKVLQAMQKALLDRTGHSASITLYFGMLEQARSAWLRQQVGLCVEALLYFARTFLLEGTQGSTFEQLSQSLTPARAARLQSVLATSKYNYPLHNPLTNWQTLAKHYPLFLDCGVDLMCSGDQFIFSEAQIRYNAPRPFLMATIKQAYQEMCASYFESNPMQDDHFERRRLGMLQDAFERFSGMSKDVDKLLIDAWTYENAYANHKKLAKKFEAEHILFDEIFKSGNPFQSVFGDAEKLFVINQPPLSMLAPDNRFFAAINNEKLEEYDDLAWPEMFDDHMKGRLFLSNPPCTDILNDKAIYEFLPDLCRFFLGGEPELPVISSKELWDLNSPHKVDEENLKWTIANQSQAVIAHRYLEGGMGIRVGKWCDSSEWNSFIDNFVRPRPYLFVVRPYFAMSPDCSLRLLTTGLVDPSSHDWQPEINIGTDMFGRISLESHVTSESSRCYLVMTRK